MGGVRGGDNLVWEIDSGVPLETIVGGFLGAVGKAGSVLIYVSLDRSPHAVLKKYLEHIPPERLVLLDCFTAGKGVGDKVFSEFYEDQRGAQAGLRAVRECRSVVPEELARELEEIESELGEKACYVFDSLTGMLELWGDERKVLSFFSYMCPRLYDLDTIAYWLLEREAHSEQFLASLRHITQVVVEATVAGGRPTVVLRKAEGRAAPSIGVPQSLLLAEGVLELAPAQRDGLEMVVLSEIAEAIGGALDLEKVFGRTMEILARELKMKRGTLVLHDKATDSLNIAAAHGLSPEEKERGRYKIGEGVTGRVVQTGQPVAVADISKDPLFLNRTRARAQEKASGPVSFICVPLRVDNEVVGALSVDRDFVDESTLMKDRRLLQIIASLVSQAIKINRMVLVQKQELVAENLRLRRDLWSRHKFGNIVAASGAMQDVVATASTVAKSSATVLLRGETGTGKELIAGVLHYNSDRADGPFVKVNCGALAENLLESELFGHVRGAFTGAVADRKGRFELASDGTIFLDEVGSISQRLQVKLLRVLQEKEFERLGGTQTIKADVRIVAATNSDLEKQVETGQFREDLYYRLNVIPISIPPLRERREDIPFLVDYFLEKYNSLYSKNVSQMSREVMDALLEFPWPGNVRQLESCIERAVVLSQSGTISMALLPINIRSLKGPAGAGDSTAEPEDVVAGLVKSLRDGAPGSASDLHARIITRFEKALIEHVLRDNAYTQSQAAKELGLSRNTVRRKIRELGIPGAD